MKTDQGLIGIGDLLDIGTANSAEIGAVPHACAN